MLQNNLYLGNTYLFEQETSVVEVRDGADGRYIVVADNIFHPKGGGQPSDVGTVDGVEAVPFKVDGESLTVGLSGDFVHAEGATVTTRIDAEARLRHAALHTCGHLIHAIVASMGFEYRGHSHNPGQARIEFLAPEERPDLEALSSEVVERVNAAIAADHKVRVQDGADGRVVEIEGHGEELCGGTHVSSLAELSDFSVRGIKIKRGGMRVGYDVAYSDPASR
ncbi:hypothetical protein [Haloglycomyces albus]|uniref:hypothetical protein n=1 Tax=Haloglycomyces albus TaxID=526067 RepID=UPI0004A4E4E3|nr:hypothetical protein [Haloglycomyces albus]